MRPASKLYETYGRRCPVARRCLAHGQPPDGGRTVGQERCQGGAMTDQDFGLELRRLRREARFGIAAFSQLIYYNKGYVSKVERGVKPPSLELARAADKVLGTGNTLESLAANARDSGLGTALSALDVLDSRVDTLAALTDLGRAAVDIERRRILGAAVGSVAAVALPAESWWTETAQRGGARRAAAGARAVGRGDLGAC